MDHNQSTVRRIRKTQAQRRAESGRSLVQAAVAIVAEQGVSAATFHAIGLRAGYHRSHVTQRFGSKGGLVDAVIEQLDARMEARLTEDRVDELTGLQALLSLFEVYLHELSNNKEFQAYIILLASAVGELTEMRRAFATHHERVKLRVARIIKRGQADGTIRRGIDADAAALMVGSLQLGLSIQLTVDPTMSLQPVRTTVESTLRLSFAIDEG